MSSQTHTLFAPFIKGEVHPTRHDMAQRYVHQWIRRTGEFASLAWSDDQISDAIELDNCRDNGFTFMLLDVLRLRDGDRHLPI
ncbi:hypothetical protein [Celeribacter baekdonensis]|uniref:hypothetical protein n=1 Tax=Celeribacter baekdonensis TaxID=875171 RepID=UPI003A950890